MNGLGVGLILGGIGAVAIIALAVILAVTDRGAGGL